MPKLEVEQRFLSVLIEFVKYANFRQLSGSFLTSINVTVSGKRSVLDVLLLFSNSFLGIEIARLICVVVSFLL